jgi:hypothetical protein
MLLEGAEFHELIGVGQLFELGDGELLELVELEDAGQLGAFGGGGFGGGAGGGLLGGAGGLLFGGQWDARRAVGILEGLAAVPAVAVAVEATVASALPVMRRPVGPFDELYRGCPGSLPCEGRSSERGDPVSGAASLPTEAGEAGGGKDSLPRSG